LSRIAAALLAVVALLTACGFQPLYGERSGGGAVRQASASIAVAPIPDRVGQLVRNHLIDSLTPGGVPQRPVYTLSIDLTQTKEGVAFQSDEQATRINVTLEANFVLRDADGDAVLTQGTTRSVAALNIVQSEFANITAEADAQRRAARQVADSIALRLGVFFSGRTE
jgi:LPS-assembly lipoprotein